jgi:glucose/arabinose dehydrogenase
MSYQPNTGKLFVVDLRGKLYRLENGKPEVYMDIAKLRPKFINQPGLATGFGSFAFHPEFAKNGLLYTTHTEAPNSGKADFSFADSIKVTVQWVLTEWKVNDPSAATFSGTGRELLRINFVTGIHGVQEITFNPLSKPGAADYGLLYIGVGDGGAVENGYAFLAHSPEKVWGTVLRINPKGNNSANGHYGIPANNPFVKNKKALGEIYAYGFRNPHRITWTHSGRNACEQCGAGQYRVAVSCNARSRSWLAQSAKGILFPPMWKEILVQLHRCLQTIASIISLILLQSLIMMKVRQSLVDLNMKVLQYRS